MSGWPEVDLAEVRRALKGKYEIYEAIAYWVKKGWRVRGQGHKYGLYPPDPGIRMDPPTWVRVDGSPRADSCWVAKRIHRECNSLAKRIENETL